jgi:enamine deaminase RidA (YjgF/YER057c/UK114 family)
LIFQVSAHSHLRRREIQTKYGSTDVRRFSGPIADELFLSVRARERASDASVQANALYETLLEALADEGADADALVSETVFLRRADAGAGGIAEARRRVLERSGNRPSSPVVTLIGQAPLDPAADLELAAVAVVPHRPEQRSITDASHVLSCPCEACKPGAPARVVGLGGDSHFRAANVHGAGRGSFEQAYDMFRVAEALLAEAGMTFRDVARTWIYLRDIDRDYDALNAARREFFRDCGIERRPASTGVQGIPLAPAHDFAMSLYAVKSVRPLQINLMSTPTLNEAWTYGAEFSRGLRVVDANKVTLHVSGTASIDEAGRTVHVGDLPAQVERMLRNIETLLAAQGATFADCVAGVTYLKQAGDTAAVRDRLRERGLAGFPCAVVEAPLCRPELLCETEVVALLPLARSGG